MPLMRQILLVASLTVVAPIAIRAGDAQVPPTPAADPEAAKKMNEILARWEAQSRKVRSLSIKFRLVDESKLFGAKTSYEGQLRVRSPDRLYVDYYELKGGRPASAMNERIVCDGKNLYQFLGPPKRCFVYPLQLEAAGEVLDMGPLPFLFGMTAAKVRERYEMTLASEDVGTYTIRAVPRNSINREDDRGAFQSYLDGFGGFRLRMAQDGYSQVLIKLDKARLLPVVIRLWAPDGKDTRTYTCSPADVAENREVAPSWFDGAAMAEGLKKSAGWTVVRHPETR